MWEPRLEWYELECGHRYQRHRSQSGESRQRRPSQNHRRRLEVLCDVGGQLRSLARDVDG